MTLGAGRFAPSPTSSLHLGNLRTAVLAWLFARTSGRDILLRIEDLDTQRVRAAAGVAAEQQADLAALGLDFDGDVLWQSTRLDAYRDAISSLDTYPCYCTRREIAEAASAPHSSWRPYPGTCLRLSAARRAELVATRPPALRVRANSATSTIHDHLHGDITGMVDDFVLVRNDGTPAYNLAVVVDDVFTGVDQVVRGEDLLESAPRQAWLTQQLGASAPVYGHVPLAVNATGQRLAKRDQAVTMAELSARGRDAGQVLSLLAHSLDLAEPGEKVTTSELVDRFDPDRIPRAPWVIDQADAL